jgi:hypothetical protein
MPHTRASKHDAPVPRIALRVEEAAAALGVSDDFYRAYIAPHVRTLRRGRVKLVTVDELQRFADENSELQTVT